MAMLPLMFSAEERIKRLQLASERVGGDAALGRMLGYYDGAFVGAMLRGTRPISEKTIRKMLEIRSLADLWQFSAVGGGVPENADHFDDQPPLSDDAVKLGRLLDLIPESEPLQRAKAVGAAMVAIVAVLEHHHTPAPIAQPAPGQKKQHS